LTYCADTAGCTGVGCIALNARQHVFRFNPVFQAGFPGFEGCRLGIATSAFWVACQAVSNSGNNPVLQNEPVQRRSRCASMFYRFIDWIH
jgi:hypothetical protein